MPKNVSSTAGSLGLSMSETWSGQNRILIHVPLSPSLPLSSLPYRLHRLTNSPTFPHSILYNKIPLFSPSSLPSKLIASNNSFSVTLTSLSFLQSVTHSAKAFGLGRTPPIQTSLSLGITHSGLSKKRNTANSLENNVLTKSNLVSSLLLLAVTFFQACIACR